MDTSHSRAILIDAVLNRAGKPMDRTIWKLTVKQQKVFIGALARPPAPNQKLREAYQRFQKYKASVCLPPIPKAVR
jgi:uncharacterized protein (DUF1778 family)